MSGFNGYLKGPILDNLTHRVNDQVLMRLSVLLGLHFSDQTTLLG